MLSTCTGSTEYLHLNVLFPNLNVDIRLDIRHNVTGYKGGLPLSLGIKGRNTNQTMNAGLGAKIAVGILSHYFHGNGFYAGFISIQIIQDFHCKAMSLRPSGIHPVENACPVIGLRSACSGI